MTVPDPSVSGADTRPAAAPRRFGGFDLLRIAAALCVILSHSFAIVGDRAHQIAFSVGHYRVALGSLGVSVFFVISGFLVAGSWDRLNDVRTFVRHRFARIWPALTVTILVTVFVMGPLVTTHGVTDYLFARRTILYLGRNVVLFVGTVNHLPGVFEDHPVRSVNGSLWTLTYEVWAYAMVLALGVFRVLRRRWVTVALFAALLMFFRLGVYERIGDLPVERSVLGMTGADGAALFSFFFAGVAASRLVGRIEPRRFALGGAASLVAAFVLREPTLYVLGIAAVVLGLGAMSGPVTVAVHRWGDPSYGLYIAAFPVQQLLFSAGVRGPWTMFVLAGLVTGALGYLSWHRLERPLLQRFKGGRPLAARGSRAAF